VAISTQAAIAHLYRRAGFGARPEEVAAAARQGYGATVTALVAGLGQSDTGAAAVALPTLSSYPADYATLRRDPAALQAFRKGLVAEHEALTDWWLARMLATTQPLAEKLTLLLHGHFPTAVSKVRLPLFMYGQNQLFRTQGPGDFTALTLAVATDPAMLIWLDAASDKASDPNENFARELMERFTMGVGTYTEADVRAAAYCFTGWRLDLATGAFSISALDHADAPQTVLGAPGLTTGQQVIELVTRTAASDRYVPAAFFSHLAYPVTPADPVVADLASTYAADRSLSSLVEAIFSHPAFLSDRATTGLAKQPVEYVVGALRALGVSPGQLAGAGRGVQGVLADMGQVLFDPPSVGGWAQNQYWLSTAAALARWRFAHRLAAGADLSAVADQPRRSRVEAAASLLSVPGWSSTTASALSGASGDPQLLVTLALVSPEYVSN